MEFSNRKTKRGKDVTKENETEVGRSVVVFVNAVEEVEVEVLAGEAHEVEVACRSRLLWPSMAE